MSASGVPVVKAGDPALASLMTGDIPANPVGLLLRRNRNLLRVGDLQLDHGILHSLFSHLKVGDLLLYLNQDGDLLKEDVLPEKRFRCAVRSARDEEFEQLLRRLFDHADQSLL